MKLKSGLKCAGLTIFTNLLTNSSVNFNLFVSGVVITCLQVTSIKSVRICHLKLEENGFLHTCEENIFLKCHQDVNVDGYFMDCVNFDFVFTAFLF